MMRIFEMLVALLIVFALAVLVGLVLPDHGHIERRVEVPSPARQVYDTINGFRRFPQYTGLRAFDPAMQTTLGGPEAGVGSKISWTSSVPKVGDGSLTITKSTQDSDVTMTLDNDWIGTNKTYNLTITPSPKGRTVYVTESYDVDYGWNLLWRFGGLYINGDPSAVVQGSLASLAAMMAGFPNTDYSNQDISVVEITAKPVLLVNTRAPRSLDEVADATAQAKEKIEAVLKKTGLTQSGPMLTITTEWGDENYTFAVAIPVDQTSFTLDGHSFTIDAPAPKADADDDSADAGQPLVAGDRDKKGLLVVDDNVRAALWYQGLALYTEYTGSAAQLPLVRLNHKAYAETHGYRYSEAGLGRPWDEDVSDPGAADDQRTFRVYLPITR
ncbi:MAG: polyketide cyclase [Dokdonella sp.]|uniref:polyketide cyclase n=1 Tax=Dokdonella sp. TaxID=2291710 RepID=UPI0025B7F807|nr:polyketide cyclase [Dokdonella sp.]MBX3699398.1 polyketide cyclase [Dokdonella sp.]